MNDLYLFLDFVSTIFFFHNIIPFSNVIIIHKYLFDFNYFNNYSKQVQPTLSQVFTEKIKDIFISKNEVKIFSNKKILTQHTHGTGCTLSSAIATYYSCGKTLKKSCEMAIKYVNEAIATRPNYGKGHGPINHLNSIEIKKRFL